jgi:hypothetical protein
MVNAFLKDPEPGKPHKERPEKFKRKNVQYLDIDDYDYYMHDGKIADKFKERKGTECIAWLLANPSVTSLRPYWISQRINPEVAEDWTKTNEKFKRQWAFMKQIIGDRREDGALKRQFAEKTHLFTAAHYLREYRDLEEWRTAIKAAQENDNEPLKILIEKFTSKS